MLIFVNVCVCVCVCVLFNNVIDAINQLRTHWIRYAKRAWRIAISMMMKGKKHTCHKESLRHDYYVNNKLLYVSMRLLYVLYLLMCLLYDMLICRKHLQNLLLSLMFTFWQITQSKCMMMRWKGHVGARRLMIQWGCFATASTIRRQCKKTGQGVAKGAEVAKEKAKVFCHAVWIGWGLALPAGRA